MSQFICLFGFVIDCIIMHIFIPLLRVHRNFTVYFLQYSKTTRSAFFFAWIAYAHRCRSQSIGKFMWRQNSMLWLKCVTIAEIASTVMTATECVISSWSIAFALLKIRIKLPIRSYRRNGVFWWLSVYLSWRLLNINLLFRIVPIVYFLLKYSWRLFTN